MPDILTEKFGTVASLFPSTEIPEVDPMLNAIIRFSLQQRLLVIAIALFFVVLGTWQLSSTSIDVFPDLNRPRVVIMTEAPGMAPEEVESLITLPIETAINGANGVEAVRSTSGVGLSVIYAEFQYGTDVYTDRQIVAERMQAVQSRLPAGITPQLAPVSSIMGQILLLGMWSDDPTVDAMELRSTADWVIRQRLLTIPGVSQVYTMGGDRKQYQVLVDPNALLRFDVTLSEVTAAVTASNQNGIGGYLDRQGPDELLVRSLGRLQSIDDIRKVPVTIRDGRTVQLSQVAEVVEGVQVKRGDSSAFTRSSENADGAKSSADAWLGGEAVVMTINKQPGADTRRVTAAVMEALEDLKPSLAVGIRISPIYSQQSFINRAIENVVEALRDGGILVVIVLFLFLLNARVTLITLTAIPLSLVITAIVFSALGLSINTMTLGGIAVAMGELVDDAIVDVENIFRRLKENRHLGSPLNPLLVVYRASLEVRRSIVFGTLIVVLAFVPLFALSGVEGKLFAPLGVAYIVSILASLLVSLTVTPVLSYWLLGQRAQGQERGDGFLLQALKWLGRRVITFSITFPRVNLLVTVLLVAIAGIFLSRLEQDFLPPFNEGAVQLNVILPPGTSLASSTAINRSVEASLKKIDGIDRFARRTGRAELDEHAEGVNMSEYIIELAPDSSQSREVQLTEIREAMEQIPGSVSSVEQPIAHLISHMLSGVKAQIGIKLFGDDLDLLRQQAEAIKLQIEQVPGVTDALVEPQTLIPQLRIELNRDRLLQYGLTANAVNEVIEVAMNGRVVSVVLEEMRSIDLLVRLQEDVRQDVEQIKRLAIPIPHRGLLPLSALADIYESSGPNAVNRDNVRRRVLIQCNVAERGVVDVVADIRTALAPLVAELPSGYYVEYGGQFQSQQSASRTIAVLFALSMLVVFLLLFTLLRSINLSLQVMAALPMAFIGAVAALVITGQTLTIAAMVGFISLAGIASRNGILLLQHYLHLVRYEGEEFSKPMIIRAGLERLAPVLMTALTSGIALIPLVLSAGEAGKEILYPVATVILGGLVSSTLLDFFVHPALFWLFGRSSAARNVERTEDDAVLLAD